MASWNCFLNRRKAFLKIEFGKHLPNINTDGRDEAKLSFLL